MIDILRRLEDRIDTFGPKKYDEVQIEIDSNLMKGRSHKLCTDMVINALNDKNSPEALVIHEELVECLWSQQRKVAQLKWLEIQSDANISEWTKNSFQAAVVDSLVFETIQGREESIPKAFEKTFSWICQREPEELHGKCLWSSFPKWLESNTDQPYWITGKPGSGKSTLMKFILQQPLLKQSLQKWAENVALLITSYYAWVAGSDLQKSCEGLKRTLLYQTLRLNPSLISIVAPRRWSLFLTLRSVSKMPSWKMWEVEESFEILLSQCGRTMKLAVFVDGLDEFESPPFQVVELIQHINACDGIKVCVASRQWTEFNDAFHQSPMLRMQDLTTADLAYFVRAKLEGNRGFLELRQIFPAEATRLIDDVAKRANGVFLWIALVVKALLEALTEGDGLPELQATVDRLPSDIAHLYDAIWSSISSRNILTSTKLLVTFKAANGPVDCLTLWLADENQSLDFGINSLAAAKRTGVSDIMRRRLDSRTRGILELSTDGTVNFLHKTARDWTLQPSVWQRICSMMPEDFDPYLLLLKAETLRVAEKPQSYFSSEGIEDPWRFVHKALWYASQVGSFSATVSELVQILDKFDNEVDMIAGPSVRVKTASPQLFERRGTQVELHWSSIQGRKSLGSKENTFLGLMAQFCVLPYLQANLPPNPNAAASNRCVSLLENAVFGFPCVNSPSDTSSPFHIECDMRVETVAFLLEKGVPRKQHMVNGKLILDEVRTYKCVPNSSDYWAQVEELMSPRHELKRALKSMFGRIKRS